MRRENRRQENSLRKPLDKEEERQNGGEKNLKK